MTKPLFGHTSRVAGTCGLLAYYGFADTEEAHAWQRRSLLTQAKPTEGTGYSVAGFVNTPICKRAYKYLVKRNNIVYQSEVRRNQNSGNDFFFVIFDRK